MTTMRFELTDDETARYLSWARQQVRGHVDDGVEPADITISFVLSSLGTSVVASCGSAQLRLRDAAD